MQKQKQINFLSSILIKCDRDNLEPKDIYLIVYVILEF